jgi:UDP-GlcNAc:undecaprenyl-phosphate GlcNAc-1-phosphate transferase
MTAPLLLLLLAALSAAIVAIMVRVGAIDHPVARSSHTTPTPKGGGMGIVAAFAVGMACAPAWAWRDGVLTGAALMLAAVSHMDDVRHWPFWRKLAAQCAAALAIIATGQAPHGVAVPGLDLVHLGIAAPVVGLAWLLFVTNATNFMDGLNGLASGSVAVACLGLALAAGGRGVWPAWLLIAGVAGFLPFNYPRARIFMGDVGSQFLGFVAGALALRYAVQPAISVILPLGLLPLLLDAALTLLRRWRRGARLTEAHRDHFYQVATRAGIGPSRVAALYWLMAVWSALCGIAATRYSPQWFMAAIVPFLVWCRYVTERARQANIVIW